MRRALLAAVAVAALLPAAVSASVGIRGVDTSGYPRVRLTVVTSTPSPIAPTVIENGKPVTAASAANLGQIANIALLIDRSRSMRGQSLENAIAASRQFLTARPAGSRIAVFAFGSTAIQLTGFGATSIDADAALRSLDVDGRQGTALNDAIVLASRALSSQSSGGRLILLVTDGRDVSSKTSLDDAVKAAQSAHALVYSVGIESPQFTADALVEAAEKTGGVYQGAASGDLVSLYSRIADELRRTWRVEFLTARLPGESLDLAVSVPGEGSAAKTVELSGSAAITPGKGSALPKSAFSGRGTLVLSLVVGGLVLLAVLLLFLKSRTEEMRRRIQPHIGQEVDRQKQAKKKREVSALRALFLSTEHVLGRTRQWTWLSKLLERGDVPLKTVEFAYVILGSGLLAGFLFSVFGLHGLMLVAGFMVGSLLPIGYVWRKSRQRINAFDEQLPDILMSVAASLKAGHSFKQAIQTMVDESEDPARKEFKRVLAETSLGRPVEDAMGEMAERLGSKNFSFIVTAVTIQNQVGGSLAGLFDMVSDTVRQRQAFNRKIKALTAMGRASAYVLIALPIFLACLLTLVNSHYMAPLFTTSSGHKLIIAGLVMMVIGSTFLRKIVSFKG